MSENGNYYRRGLGLKAEVKPVRASVQLQAWVLVLLQQQAL